MPGEFDIIARHFQQAGLAADPARDKGVVLGIGDDCALLTVPRGQQLAISMDVLVEGVHFPPQAPAEGQATRSSMSSAASLS